MFIEVYKAIDDIADYLVAQGVDIPDAYKRRDPLEPGRTEKEMYEDKLAKLIKRRFNTQKRIIAESLKWSLPKKSVDDWMDRIGDLSDPETEKRIFQLFVGAMEHGGQLFGQSINFELDWDQYSQDASDQVKKYIFGDIDKDIANGWLAGLDKTTLDGLKQQLTNFVEIEGYTIGDVMRGLPFEEHRLQRIAVTEITRLYGSAEQLAGEQLMREFPDVPVIKTWFTNNDDLVCPICAPLNMMTVPIDQEFADGIDKPPAHVNCRCWMGSRTDIGGETTTPPEKEIEFVPAKNKAEIMKRMRLMVDDYDVQMWDELSLDVQNSILKSVEELHDPSQPNLSYIKYKIKRTRGWGRAVLWEDGSRGIELQKTFLRNPSRVMSKEIANSLALHESDIQIIKERLALPHLPDARRIFYEEKLLRLQNNPVRYLVCESADDPVYSVVSHEMWHIKDFDSGLEFRKTFESLFTPETNELLWGVSEYSMTAKKEAFAEVGSAYTSGVKIPSVLLNIFLEAIGAK